MIGNVLAPGEGYATCLQAVAKQFILMFQDVILLITTKYGMYIERTVSSSQ